MDKKQYFNLLKNIKPEQITEVPKLWYFKSYFNDDLNVYFQETDREDTVYNVECMSVEYFNKNIMVELNLYYGNTLLKKIDIMKIVDEPYSALPLPTVDDQNKTITFNSKDITILNSIYKSDSTYFLDQMDINCKNKGYTLLFDYEKSKILN